MDQPLIDRLWWFHAMELPGGLVTPGRQPRHVPPNSTLFPVFQLLESIDVEDRTCLDIGAMDGLASFMLRLRGGRVVATDIHEKDGFTLVRSHLGLDDVAYLPGVAIDGGRPGEGGGELEQALVKNELPTRFDLVLLAGVIYHAHNPLTLLMHARRLVAPGGLLLVETACHSGRAPVLHVNSEARHPVREQSTFFLPTVPALHGMLRLCCAEPLATVRNPGSRRVAVLARATSPESLPHRTPMLDLLFSDASGFGPLHFLRGNAGEAEEPSAIRYTGRTGEWTIDREGFRTTLPLQPHWHLERPAVVRALRRWRGRAAALWRALPF